MVTAVRSVRANALFLRERDAIDLRRHVCDSFGYNFTNKSLNRARECLLQNRNKLIERVKTMATKRRKCKLVNSDYSGIDLRKYEKIIKETVEKVVPGKNPKVFKEYFSTDPLSQGESVSLGRELSKLDELKGFGKAVTTFRLFDGKTYDSEEDSQPSKPATKKTKGGRKK